MPLGSLDSHYARARQCHICLNPIYMLVDLSFIIQAPPHTHCVRVAVYLMMDEWAEVAAYCMFCFEVVDKNDVKI